MILYNLVVEQSYVQGNNFLVDFIVMTSDNNTTLGNVRLSYIVTRRLEENCICCKILVKHYLSTKKYDMIAEIVLNKSDINNTLFFSTESEASKGFYKFASQAECNYDEVSLIRLFGAYTTLLKAMCYNIPQVILNIL